jgi:hypothetical protein
MKKKQLKGKLTLNQETIANLTRAAMGDVIGRTTENCESMVLSCDPKKWLCDTCDLVCQATHG